MALTISLGQCFIFGFIDEMFVPRKCDFILLLLWHIAMNLCQFMFYIEAIHSTNRLNGQRKPFSIWIFVVKTLNIVQCVFTNRHKTNILSNEYKHILWYSLGTYITHTLDGQRTVSRTFFFFLFSSLNMR